MMKMAKHDSWTVFAKIRARDLAWPHSSELCCPRRTGACLGGAVSEWNPRLMQQPRPLLACAPSPAPPRAFRLLPPHSPPQLHSRDSPPVTPPRSHRACLGRLGPNRCPPPPASLGSDKNPSFTTSPRTPSHPVAPRPSNKLSTTYSFQTEP